MSLRTRLVLGLVAVAAIGLLASNVATYAALSSFLNRRVDQQLQEARFPVLRGLSFGSREQRVGPGSPIAPGTFGQLRDSSGVVLAEVVLGAETQSVPHPDLPAVLPSDRSRRPQVFTVGGLGSSSYRYRVLAEPLAESGGTVVFAVPLREVSQTLASLLRIEIAVGVAAMFVLGGLALWVVRLGLRPLREMEDAAGAIAAGDLSRRIDPARPGTEVGRLGTALNEMLTQIERAFAERTASEDRLRRFLADASHELRTPLTSIRGYAELFRRGADTRPEDLAKVLQRIEGESERMGVLVDDLLLLARLDQGRPLESDPVDLVALASDAVADARATDPAREVRLDAPDPAVVLGDETRLRQVAANLLSNALEHTPPGTPVDVRVHVHDSTAALEVADHGPGLQPDEAARVFERFYRSDPSRARDGSGGAGLGLAIVAAIAEAHGGAVCVDSEPGAGARFSVSLPLLTERP